ncbi:MAG: hypothetical protein LBG80_00625 [Bacteroidales bacterium]|nr:hypothetical protein [Bacteroidales bacterium]
MEKIRLEIRFYYILLITYGALRYEVEMKNVLKINAGIACLDRANEVEPRPNEISDNAF